MDTTLRLLHNLLGTVDEDLESVTDVQGEVCTQAEAHRQTTVAVDDTDTDDSAGVHGVVDAQRPATNGTDNGYGAEVLAVFE